MIGYKKINPKSSEKLYADWLIVDPPIDTPISLGCFWTNGRAHKRLGKTQYMNHMAGVFWARRIPFI